jgi:hypothetical protein
MVRRELQKALSEEHAAHGTTQASIAAELNINRSVIHRQLMGIENLTLGRVGEIAELLGREPYFALTKPAAAVGNHVGHATVVNNLPQSLVSKTPQEDFAYGAGRPQSPDPAHLKAA